MVGYEIIVTNNGPAHATNVSLVDSLPTGLTATLNNGAVSQGSYDGTNWIIGDLAPSTAATLTLEGVVDPGTAGNTISNTTTAAVGDQPDVFAAGDDLIETVIVEGLQNIPIVDWLASSGGVSVSGNSVSYSGIPSGWSSNSVNSVPFSSLGVFDDYSVRWQVASEPASTTWVVGLGVNESGKNWRDVDYGLRSSNGELTVYENGVWRLSSATLNVGDELAIYVGNGRVQYRLNDTRIFATPIHSGDDFYIDTSFKNGAIVLENFVIETN